MRWPRPFQLNITARRAVSGRFAEVLSALSKKGSGESPQPESTESNWHLGRGCGLSPRPPEQTRILGADAADPGVVSCARSVTHRRMRSLPCSSPPAARHAPHPNLLRPSGGPELRASSPARVQSRINGCAPSRARRLLRLVTPRIPICGVRSVDPGLDNGPVPAPPARRPAYVLPLLAGAYLAAVTLFMVFVLHLSVSPERLLLLMLIAALVLGRTRLFLTDWIPFLILFLGYEYLRGLGGKIGMPIHDVTGLERLVCFGQVPTILLQQAFYHAGRVSWYDIAATMFYFLHFAFPLGLGYLFWIIDRGSFLRFSRALIAMAFAAFFFYLLLPVAPPWIAVPGVVKIIDHTLPSFTDLPGVPVPATLYHWLTPNLYAAMPSLHAAFPFLGALFALRLWGKAAWPTVVYAMCVWLSLVYLGEHYVVDIIGGVVFALGAFFGEELLTRWWRRHHPLHAIPSRSFS
ncbi:MAG: phosphatase PAP2 family protein [Chloroflexi bacterium]|nr:MAG: phosphatase PAP2 family protein [Chloroflexota bacterium]